MSLASSFSSLRIARAEYGLRFESAGPKGGCLNVGDWNPQESGRKAPLSCNAAFSMPHCSFSLVAAQLLVKMTSALQKSQCCSATSAAQHSGNCGATSVFACGMLQEWGLEGWGLGLADWNTELSEFFGPHRVPGRELSEFLSAYYLCASSQRELTEFAAELSEFAPLKQYSRNSILPVS